MKSYNNILTLFRDLKRDIKTIHDDLSVEFISSTLLRVYYMEKSILDISYIKDSDSFIIEDYLDNKQISKPEDVYKDIETILLSLNYIQEGYIVEGRKPMSIKRRLDEDLMDIDFEEFDEIIAKEVIAKKAEDEIGDEVIADDDFDEFDDELLDIDDGYLDVEEIEDEVEEEPTEEEPLEEPAEEEEIIDETGDAGPIEDEPEMESAKPSTKSLLQIYEDRRSRKKNKIVESLLVDNTVEDIERVLKDTLDSHGISAAERVSVLGLILDRMLHASDEEIEAPEYLNDMIGDVVEDKDIADLISDTVQKVLDGDTEPLPPAEATLEDDVKVDLITSEGIEEITAEDADKE